MKKSIKKSPKNNFLFDYLGWGGVGLLLLAYILLSSEVILGASYTYQLIALIGCLAIAVEAMHKRDLQPAVLNFVFVLIAIAAIGRIAFLD